MRERDIAAFTDDDRSGEGPHPGEGECRSEETSYDSPVKPFGDGDMGEISAPCFQLLCLLEQTDSPSPPMDEHRNSHSPQEPQFDPRYPLPHPDNLDEGMSYVLNLHNPAMSMSFLSAPSHLASNPSLCSWDTAPAKARIMWLQGLGGRSGLGNQGSLIEQLAKARYTYNSAANRVKLRPIPQSYVEEDIPDHYLPPEGVTDPNAGHPFMSLVPVFARIVAFGGVGVALRMRITCKKLQMEFGPEDAGSLGLDDYEKNLKVPSSQGENEKNAEQHSTESSTEQHSGEYIAIHSLLTHFRYSPLFRFTLCSLHG